MRGFGSTENVIAVEDWTLRIGRKNATFVSPTCL